jgi:hypothetical protein
MLKYGDGKHIDKLMRADHPNWPSARTVRDLLPFMYHVVSQALKNPMISPKAAAKAAAFPHEYTSSLMGDYLRDNHTVHPDVLTAIAKHNGHREYIRSMLDRREGMTKEAYGHLASHVQDRINRLNPAHEEDRNLHTIYSAERDGYLQKAQ